MVKDKITFQNNFNPDGDFVLDKFINYKGDMHAIAWKRQKTN